MQCSFKQYVLTSAIVIICFPAHADFDDATKAYLLGDFEKARYEALVAAMDGSAQAQMLMGQLYFKGEGVEKDLKLALYWYEKAATNNFDQAQFRLGSLYFNGANGVAKDYDHAYKWLKKALENGYRGAQPILENLYQTDSGKVVNLDESIEVLQQVADKGDKLARFLLSQKLLKGNGLTQDKLKAVKMLSEDARRGFIKAQKRLGELYYYGDGVQQDYFEAYAWSMAYAGTNELGGLAREGKQTARSALRKLPEQSHNDAYLKSRQYYEKYVVPYHPNAREVGPDKYRIVVRSTVKSEPVKIVKQAGSVPAAAPTTATRVASPESAKADIKAPQAAMPSAMLPAILPKKGGLSTRGDKNADTGKEHKPVASHSPAKSNRRSYEQVAILFARNKKALDAIYNQALANSPHLAGKIVIKMEIDPAGHVSQINQVSSELNAPDLEAKLLQELRKLEFGAKDVAPITITYPFHFSPARNAKKVSSSQTEPRQQVSPAKSEFPAASGNNESATETAAGKSGLKQDQPAAPATPDKAALTDVKTTVPQTSSEEVEIIAPSPVTAKSGVDPAAEDDNALAVNADQVGESVDSGATPVAERDFQTVYNVLVRKKSSLYGLYLREYELDKKLQGRIVFDIVIAPNGTISAIEVVNNELESPTLEQTLIDFLKTNVSFAKANVAPFKITYPVDFLPPMNWP